MAEEASRAASEAVATNRSLSEAERLTGEERNAARAAMAALSQEVAEAAAAAAGQKERYEGEIGE